MVQDGHGGQSEITTSTVSRRLALQVDIDASYSMQGSRMETAVHGLSSLLDVLRPTDLCGVSTFSTEVQNLHRVMQRSKVDAGKDAVNVRANTARGGATAFYDAVIKGIEGLKQAKDYLRSRQDRQCMPEFEHVVITDGGDNSSRASLAEVAALVAKPGLRDYQFVVIGVGIDDATASTLMQLCRPVHAHFHREPDADALSRRLASLTESYVLNHFSLSFATRFLFVLFGNVCV